MLDFLSYLGTPMAEYPIVLIAALVIAIVVRIIYGATHFED